MTAKGRTGVVGVEPWDPEWAAERAGEALRYLGTHYPDCLDALRVLDEHETAAHEAALLEGHMPGEHEQTQRKEATMTEFVSNNETNDTPNQETTDAVQAARAKAAVGASEILTSYHDKVAEIRDDDALEDGPNNDYLSPEAKAEIIRDRKRVAANELYESTVSEYHKTFDTLAEEAEKHTPELGQALFGLSNEGSAALAQAISADQAKLLEMIKLGELTGADSISRAAFAAAVTRGDAPEVVHTYLQKNPDAEPLLRLYEAAPTKEWIETQKENVGRLIQPPTEDQLASRPQIRAF